jgi:N-acetylglucosamine-6-phosphate deacetylase
MTSLVGRVLAPEDLGMRVVTVSQHRIVAIEDVAEAPPDALGGPDSWILPGLVDIQLNGAFGADFSDPDADVAGAAARLPETGVTAFLPTIVSSPPDRYLSCLPNLTGPAGDRAARCLGVHLEGPFLAPARRGTHDPAALRAPDLVEVGRWLDAGPVRSVTLAPELPGGLELVRELVSRNVIVAMGHSDASWDEADAAIDAGARLGTHLFNAMRPFHHREPGITGRLLAPGVAVSVIVDGIHVTPQAVRLVASIKAPDELIFVTDGLGALGEPPGTYLLAGREVISDGIVARLPDGTLSGSVVPMAPALGRLVAAGLEPSVAARAASTTPARLLGAEDRLGRLEVGRIADLTLLDAEWNPTLTLVQGRIGYAAPAIERVAS